MGSCDAISRCRPIVFDLIYLCVVPTRWSQFFYSLLATSEHWQTAGDLVMYCNVLILFLRYNICRRILEVTYKLNIKSTQIN